MAETYEWDENKAANNFAKHGISFVTAIEVFDDPCSLTEATFRAVDGEYRFKTIGYIAGRLYTVIHVERDGRIRLISARRANAKEERRYGNRDLYP